MDKKKFYQEPSVRVVKVQVAHMIAGTNETEGENNGAQAREYRSFDDEG